MPVGRRFDFQIGGKGFILARPQPGGRSWHRTGRSDTPGQRSVESTKYGALPDELDHVDVWNDWSSGYGNAYYKPEQPKVYHWSENIDSRWPRQLIHCQALDNAFTKALVGSPNAINAFLDVLPTATTQHARIGAGAVMVLADQYFEVATPIYNNDLAAGSIIATSALMRWGYRPAVFGSYIYVPNLSGTSFQQVTFDGVASPNVAGMPAAGFAVAGNRLWRYHGPGTKRIYVQSCAAGIDPLLTANWSATITIGNGQYDISDMIAVEDQIFIGMPDGMYVGDQSGTFYNVLSQLASQRHQDNCRTLVPYGNGVLAPHQGGLYYYQQNDFSAVVRDVGPNLNSNRSPVRGRITALETRGPWVYAGLWTGSESYLLVGRDTGETFAWHPMQRMRTAFGARRISAIHIDGITTTSGGLYNLSHRLWIGGDSSGSARTVYNLIPIPANDTNPLNADPDFIVDATSPWYIASARIDLGIIDSGAPATSKLYRSFEVWADNLATGSPYCNVYYDVDRSGSFKLLGTIAKSPKDTLYFSTGEGSFVTGQSIELSLQSFTSTAPQTPVYRGFALRSSFLPRSVDMIQAVVRVTDNLHDRQGQPMRSGATMLQELRDLANPNVNVGPHQLIDLAGATAWAKVMPPIEEQEVWQQGSEYPEIAATVRMAVLNYS